MGRDNAWTAPQTVPTKLGLLVMCEWRSYELSEARATLRVTMVFCLVARSPTREMHIRARHNASSRHTQPLARSLRRSSAALRRARARQGLALAGWQG